MDAETARHLIALNRRFYQNLAAPFSATRSKLQPGVLRVLARVPSNANILDLGCGNGGVAAELARRGSQGKYVGLDTSDGLLEAARLAVGAQHAAPVRFKVEFMQADLSSPKWKNSVPDSPFEFIFAFAVLHHLPSREIRLSFLRQVRSLLAPGGRFVLSNWQFLNSPRLEARVQPWEAIGLSDSQVDEGDYLLDWRSGGQGVRYVHHFDGPELIELAAETGFQVEDEFLSDGKTGNLAMYQVWIPAKL